MGRLAEGTGGKGVVNAGRRGVAWGVNSPPGSPPLTDRVKRAFKVAHKEQEGLRHPVPCAEHILLGLLADKRAMSSFVLRELKVDLEALESRARDYLKRAAPDVMVGEVALLKAAERWVAELKQVSIGTEHLLLALVGTNSAAAKWLAEAGVKEAEVRETTLRLMTIVPRGSGPTTPPEE